MTLNEFIKDYSGSDLPDYKFLYLCGEVYDNEFVSTMARNIESDTYALEEYLKARGFERG